MRRYTGNIVQSVGDVMARCDKAFLIFHDWRCAFEDLSGDECKEILLAMFDYSKDGTEPPTFSGMAKMAANFIFPAMERSNERAKAGRIGGLKRAENAAKDNLLEATLKHTSSTLEAPLKYTCDDGQAIQANGNSLKSASTTRQDKDKTKQDKDKTLQDDDKDETRQCDASVDVSSVVKKAKEYCGWLDITKQLPNATVLKMLNNGYTMDDYELLFKVAAECPFLNGGGERGWKADIVWLIDHADEVATGKYKEWHKGEDWQNGGNSSFDTHEFFNLALNRVSSEGDNE